MRDIDERVVEMRFDNAQFEKGVGQTMGTLDKLKNGLNFKKSGDSLDNLEGKVRKFSFSGMAAGIDNISSKFNALGAVGFSVIQRLTNKIISMATNFARQFTIQPITDGFREYELKMGSVQTILANTARHGTKLDDVTKSLDSLNEYADKTIYNFGDMTRNIGLFTNAGLKVEESTSMIKGFSNAAAASGTNAQGASQAAYQLSQALSTGTVRLMDWRSLTNVGMGNKNMQDDLIKIADAMGVLGDAGVTSSEIQKDFNGSLQEGWLTADVMSKYLQIMAGDMDAAAMKQLGLGDEQIKSLQKQQKTAEEAATKVRTFTQLIDTAKEAVGSGWAKTFETLVGNFDDATDLFTNINDKISKIIDNSSKSRNDLLEGWVELGGRTSLINTFSNAFKGLGKIASVVGDAFRDIFPPTTAKQLTSITKRLEAFSEKLVLSDETADKLKRTFKGVFSTFSTGWEIIKDVAGAFGDILESAMPLGDSFLDITAAVGDFLVKVNKAVKAGKGLSGLFEGIGDVISSVVDKISDLVGGIAGAFSGDGGNGIVKFVESLSNGIGTALSGLADIIGEIDFTAIFAGLTAGGVILSYKKIKSFFDNFFDNAFGGLLKSLRGEGDEVKGFIGNIKDTLSQLTESLSAMTTTLNATSLLMIASAIGILAVSVSQLAKIDGRGLIKSLTALSILFGELTLFMGGMSLLLKGGAIKGLTTVSASMVLMAVAVKILASAVEDLGALDLTSLSKGLVGVLTLVVGVSAATRLSVGKAKMMSTAVGLVLIAGAIKILASAVEDLSVISWTGIGKGIAGIAGLMGALVIFTRTSKLDSTGIRTGASMILIAGAMKLFASAIKDISELDSKSIIKGVGGIAGVLGSIAIFTRINDPKKMITSASAILIISLALEDIGNALKRVGQLSWEQIAKGLTGIGAALLEFGIVLGLLGKVAPVGAIGAAGAILLAVQSLSDISDALSDIGSLSWGEIARGLVGMGGALTELAVITGVLGSLAPIGGILGSGAILLGVQALQPIADALKDIGKLTWDEIARGLTGMGGALSEIAIIAGLLGTLAPVAGFLGSASILIAVQGLGDIADALGVFGSMSWGEIDRGLKAMAGALGILAGGTVVNSLGIIGSLSIATVAEPLGVLADSLKKWATVSLPEDMSRQLADLALGVSAFTFAFGGSFSISILSGSLGTLASDVSKWNGVKIPADLTKNLKGLADGVKAFTWAFMGGFSIDSITPGLGNLASDVKKWAGVTISDGMDSGLKRLADGVKSFTWAFMGGFSIESISPALGNLASDVKRWNGVTVTPELESGLKALSSGLQGFTWLFMSGWSLSALTGPLGDLAGSVKKWSGVTIPPNLESGLKSIANGIKEFPEITLKHNTIDAITDKLIDLAEAVKAWNGLGGTATSLEGWLKAVWGGVKAFPETQNQHATIESLVSPLKKLASAMTMWKDTRVPSDFDTQMTRLMRGINALDGDADFTSISSGITSVKNAVKGITVGDSPKNLDTLSKSMSRLATESKKSSTLITSAFIFLRIQLTLHTGSINRVVSKNMNELVQVVARVPANIRIPLMAIVGTFRAMTPLITRSARSMVTSMVSAINSALSGAEASLRRSALSVGRNISAGMVQGMNSGSASVSAAARQMAAKALSSAKATLGVHSPSREFEKIGHYVTQGLVNGLDETAKNVYSSAESMADEMLGIMTFTMDSITGIVESEYDYQPTIKPVVDISDIKAKSEYINGLASTTTANGASRISETRTAYSVSPNLATSGKNVTIEFNQTNNSPKALSRIDVYRQTRNQLSALKGALSD